MCPARTQHHLLVSPVCEWNVVPNTGVRFQLGYCVSSSESQWDLQVSNWSEWGVLDPRHWDRNYVCPKKKKLLEGPAWVRDLQKPVFLVPSQNCVSDICVHKLILSRTCWRVGGLGLNKGLAGSMLGCGSLCPWDKACDCCMFVASTELHQLESRNLWGG